MINILLAGVGGQGSVLAAKVLAQAAESKGWQVRTAETIGMAQRGGSVTSHVRMGNEGEEVYAPLLMPHSADIIIAFEPAEAARVLSFLADGGVIITASTAIQPVTAALSKDPYRGEDMIDLLKRAMDAQGNNQTLVVVDDATIMEEVGNRRALNTVLLAYALAQNHVPISVDELRQALVTCVKPAFVEVNMKAVDEAVRASNASSARAC